MTSIVALVIAICLDEKVTKLTNVLTILRDVQSPLDVLENAMTGNRLDTFTSFGELLRHLRRQAQLTQQQLGIAVGYSPTMITRLESNERLPELASVKTVFLEALSLRPESEPAKLLIELAEKAHRSANKTAALPLLWSQSVPITNLPTQLTSTIGRQQNIADVQRLLMTSRLVTLTGSGGVGKTRLAIEVGSRLLGQFPAGVWLIELAPATDASLVPHIAAAVFGVQERSHQSAIQALTAYLTNRPLLIILDNCEHIITASSVFAEQMLRSCSLLRILATSREVLRIPGEVAWRVPSLVTPEPAALLTAEQLMDYASTKLFVQQATSAQPGFTLTDENAPAVAQICQHLDGIPLAIEMAAARLRGMTVNEIAVRLDQRFQLLTSGRRTALPRHQTLRAALEWSYHLLSESERMMLERLSVFADGCLADSAEVVCAEPPIRAADVLPLLLALVDKSLLFVDKRGLLTRYRMLETVRAYASERLAERHSNESERLHERHAVFVIELSDRWKRKGLTGSEKTSYILRLETELNNVRALLSWARDRPDNGVMSLELAAALWTLWVSGGFLSEGQEWLEEALARTGTMATLARARALDALASILRTRGEYAHIEHVSGECLEIAERNNDVRLTASSLGHLGMVAQCRLNFEHAAADITRSLDLMREAGLTFEIPGLLVTLGQVYVQCSETSKAVDCLEEGVARSIQLDILPNVAEGRRYLSLVHMQQALQECVEDAAYYRAKNHPRGLAMSLLTLGHLLAADGQYEEANSVLAESYEVWHQIGLVRPGSNGGAPLALFELARLAWLQGLVELARQRYLEYKETTMLAGDNTGLAYACLWIGYLALDEGDFDTADSHFRQSLALWQVAWHQTVVLAALARLAETKGDPVRAARLYGAASARQELVRTSLTTTDCLVFNRDMEAAHTRHSNPDWAAACVEGRAMTMEQAIAYALEGTSGG